MGHTCSVCGSGDKATIDESKAKTPLAVHRYSAAADAGKWSAEEEAAAAARKRKQERKEEKDRDFMEPAFNSLDINGDGVISKEEWQKVQSQMVTKSRTSTTDRDDRSPKKTSKKRGNRYSPDELEELFHKVDLDRNGVVDVTELAMLFRLLGMAYTTKSIKDLLSLIDEDQGGTISLPEFLSFFSNTKKGLDLGEVVTQALQEQAKKRMQDSDKIDVFIIHAMEPDVGYRRCYWLADLLESQGLTCAGPYRRAQMMLEHPDARAEDKYASFVFRIPDEQEDTTGSMAIEVPDLSRCKSLVLLLDNQSLVGKSETDVLDAAGDAGIPVACFYEHEFGYHEDLEAWKTACPLVLEKTQAKPMSRFFPRDSGELCGAQILHLLKRTSPLAARPPEDEELRVEYENFQTLGQIPGIRWLTPEFAMVIDGSTVADLPDTAFGFPGRARPVYLSYPHATLGAAGLTAKQLAKLRIVLHGHQIEGRVMFYDAVSIEQPEEQGSATLLTDVDVFREVALMSMFIIIDDVDPDGPCKEPHLARGQCFLEAVIAVLTGNFLPTRPGQLEALDRAIGRELSSGGRETLRQMLRANARNAGTIINRLCTLLKKKKFASPEEKDLCVHFFTDALQRHPFLVEGGDGGMVGAMSSKRSMAGRLSVQVKGLKNVVTKRPSVLHTEAKPKLSRKTSALQVVGSMLGGKTKRR